LLPPAARFLARGLLEEGVVLSRDMANRPRFACPKASEGNGKLSRAKLC
jgi:hypothetical protein